jgi:hypothetical protein
LAEPIDVSFENKAKIEQMAGQNKQNNVRWAV